jgi:hypothetical protein
MRKSEARRQAFSSLPYAGEREENLKKDERRTPNVERPMSNEEVDLESLPFIRRSKFGVRCSTFVFGSGPSP